MNIRSHIQFISRCLVLIHIIAGDFAMAKQNSKSLREPSVASQKRVRVHHARELLGRHYSKSIVKSGEDVARVNAEIYQWTKSRLVTKDKRQYRSVAKAIVDESRKHKFDPIFVLSVIQSESSFVPTMVGKVGEIGLMQIRPGTGKWVSGMANLPWKGSKTLLDPVANVRIGVAFLSYLRTYFDKHAQLYLAAYNMGQGNVQFALSKDVWPKDYPNHVMKNYVDFYASLKEKHHGLATRSI
jgi:soluble lytic murein transglycosylase